MDILSDFLHSAFVYALAWTIVHSLWQALVIAGILGLSLESVAPAKARVRYNLAVAAMLALCLMAALSFWYYYSVGTDVLREQAAAVSATEVPAAMNLYPAPGTDNSAERLSLGLIGYLHRAVNGNATIIVLVWLAGLVLMAGRYLGGYAYLYRMAQRGTRPGNPEWDARVNVLRKRLGIGKTVRLLESASAKAPMVFGFIKPVIFLPLGTLTGLPADQVEAIIAHELAHIRRNDFLFNLLQSLVEILFFYHPAVKWMSNRLRAEREHCCDDLAVAATGNSLVLIKALAHIQEHTMQSPEIAPAFSGNKRQLLQRVQRLAQTRCASDRRERSTSILAMIFAVLMLLGGAGVLSAFGDRVESAPSAPAPESSALPRIEPAPVAAETVPTLPPTPATAPAPTAESTSPAAPSTPQPLAMLQEGERPKVRKVQSVPAEKKKLDGANFEDARLIAEDMAKHARDAHIVVHNYGASYTIFKIDEHSVQYVLLLSAQKEVLGLEVDGKLVPASDYEKHAALIKAAIQRATTSNPTNSKPAEDGYWEGHIMRQERQRDERRQRKERRQRRERRNQEQSHLLKQQELEMRKHLKTAHELEMASHKNQRELERIQREVELQEQRLQTMEYEGTQAEAMKELEELIAREHALVEQSGNLEHQRMAMEQQAMARESAQLELALQREKMERHTPFLDELKRTLREDGLVSNVGAGFRLELDTRGLRINGQTQDDNMYTKYKRLIESYHDTAIKDGLTYIFESNPGAELNSY